MNRLSDSAKSKKKRDPKRTAASATNKGVTTEFDEEELRDSLARELLAVCVNTLKKRDLSVRRISQLAREAIESNAEIPATTRLFQDISDLGLLASEWAENPAYVDSIGRPKVLPICGDSASFRHLAKKYFCSRSIGEVLQLGYKMHVLEPVGASQVGHLGACVLLTGNSLMLFAHAVRSIRWFLGTAEYNAHAERSTVSTWPERQAFTELPEDEFQELLRFMREPIINLTEMSNRWLMARAAERQSSGRAKKITMGVQAYVFRDT